MAGPIAKDGPRADDEAEEKQAVLPRRADEGPAAAEVDEEAPPCSGIPAAPARSWPGGGAAASEARWAAPRDSTRAAARARDTASAIVGWGGDSGEGYRPK